MYTDSHCHPENKRFDADRPDVFARANAAGVDDDAGHRQWRRPGDRHV